MKTTSLKFIGALLLFGLTGFVWASNGYAVEDKQFVVETDEESAAESLNRISGDVDRGYALPEQTYRSDHHTRPGAFQRSEEMSDSLSPSDRY